LDGESVAQRRVGLATVGDGSSGVLEIEVECGSVDEAEEVHVLVREEAAGVELAFLESAGVEVDVDQTGLIERGGEGRFTGQTQDIVRAGGGVRVNGVEAVEMMESTELLVAGRGPADLYRSGKARFLGPVSDLPALFAAADVLVAPTLYDPFSNACLEALSAGLPVITTPANGFSEILEQGLHGDIFPCGDALALAEFLETWKHPGRAESARAACLSRAAEFSIERNARETLEILKSAAR